MRAHVAITGGCLLTLGVAVLLWGQAPSRLGGRSLVMLTCFHSIRVTRPLPPIRAQVGQGLPCQDYPYTWQGKPCPTLLK